ncbi:MAG: (Fe-S)-binding protein [Verrucomicrobiales bacterium]
MKEIDKPAGRKVLLMATCLCDAFFADVAKATVEVLEHAGCEVIFPPDQTCCGQPAFNGGDFPAARRVARHTMEVFAGDLPVIVPSGSCAAMHVHGNLLLFEDEADLGRAQDLARRTWELCDFLVNGIGIERWEGRLDAKIALHDSCHTRGTRTGAAMRSLLGGIEGLEVLEIGEGDQCCGFGGTFAVTFPHISGEMGTLKLDHALSSDPDRVVSGDMSCLMHLAGLAERQGRKMPVANVAQILRDALEAQPAEVHPR